MTPIKMMISPIQAKEWLAQTNTRNRPLSVSRARIYAADMKAGNWYETHQGIAFYDDGVLADGQTRLKAITIANIPVEMLVSFGLPQNSSLGIDAHRMRATSDQISITHGSGWIGKSEIAIAKMILRSEVDQNSRLTTTEMIVFCEKHKDRILFVSKSLLSPQKYISTAPVRCAVALAYGKEDSERLMQFCKVLQSGVMESANDVAAIRLRERLLLTGHGFHANEGARIECSLVTQRAIKAFCTGEQIKKLFAPAAAIYTLKA